MAAAQTAGLARKLIVQSIVWLAVTGVLLFGSAGTLRWPQAWALLAVVLAVGLASGLTLTRDDPELVRERLRGPIQSAQKPWDKALLAAILALSFVLFVVAGLDAVRFRATSMPLWLEAAGAIAVALSFYIFHIVLRENSYATSVVRIQSERGHHVISTGPYAYVRHPMYLGAVFYFIGSALLLGSWYAVGVAVVIVVLFAVRAVWEEQTLAAELPGYAEYARRVRYRLVPGVW